MHEPLIRLRKELAKTIIEVQDQNNKKTFPQDSNIQFTFNGFSTINHYQIHLRQFYDHFKTELDHSLKETDYINDRYQLLETIQINLIESEKLDSSLSISDLSIEEILFNAYGVLGVICISK